MRILLHSNAPWVPSGYGTQCAYWALKFKEEGHDVAISSFYGLQGSSFMWPDGDGVPVFPGELYSDDGLVGHYKFHKADVLITLIDIWVMVPGILEPLNAYCWFPVDTNDNLSLADQQFLIQSKCKPIAMSRHGDRLLHKANYDSLYAPHGINTDIFRPMSPEERAYVRELGNLDDKTFVIGICAANKSKLDRKAFAQQFQAFKLFHDQHPNSVLYVHSNHSDEFAGDGLDLRVMAHRYGIADMVRFSEQYPLLSGRITPPMMARWFGHLDLLSATSKGEGFGLPIIEAQACGTPVVVTRTSSMTELCGSGWKVGGQQEWHDQHKASWITPEVEGIAARYEQAYEHRGDEKLIGDQGMRVRAVKFAQQYSVDNVWKKYWKPALEEIEAHL